MENRSDTRRVLWWLLAMAVTGASTVLLWLDTYQQDAGNHFLGARWAWKYHANFIDAWNRPLFVWAYALPSQLGWNAARLFSVLIAMASAWQTWRLAQQLGLKNAWLTVPLLWLQPSFFLLSADVMTEPLHGLVLVCALRLFVAGRVKWAMIVASLLILARPEGLFCGILWGVWVLLDRRVAPKLGARILWSLLLASGGVLWLLVSWALTGDPLWVIHHWPSNWKQGAYGYGRIWGYTLALPEIIGLLFIPALVAGLWRSRTAEAGSSGLRCVAGMWLMVFCLHTVLWAWGLMGATGYARFMVTVAPAGAIVLLVGWNALAARFPGRRPWLTPLTFAVMLFFDVLYVDGWGYSRDARGIADSWHWWQQTQTQRPVSRLLWSHTYACIVTGRDPGERLPYADNKVENLELLKNAGSGTLAIWESEIGPAWFNLTDADFAAAGYERVRSQSYTLGGVFLGQSRWWLFAPRTITVHLFYKP